jgi:serine/threonine protein kinase
MLRTLATGDSGIDGQWIQEAADVSTSVTPLITTQLEYKSMVLDSVPPPLKVKNNLDGKRTRKQQGQGKQLTFLPQYGGSKAIPIPAPVYSEEANEDWKGSWRTQCSRFEKTRLVPSAYFSQEFSHLIEVCMSKNPNYRPKIRQLKVHPFLRRCETLDVGMHEIMSFLKIHKAKLHGHAQHAHGQPEHAATPQAHSPLAMNATG